MWTKRSQVQCVCKLKTQMLTFPHLYLWILYMQVCVMSCVCVSSGREQEMCVFSCVSRKCNNISTKTDASALFLSLKFVSLKKKPQFGSGWSVRVSVSAIFQFPTCGCSYLDQFRRREERKHKRLCVDLPRPLWEVFQVDSASSCESSPHSHRL